jgi:hypothetical protein
MKIKSLFFTLLLSSCSFMLNQVEENYGAITSKPVNDQIAKKTYCEESSSLVLFSANKNNQKTFIGFIQKLESKKFKLSSIDLAVLWALAQMSIRPDLNSPTARLTIGYNRGSKARFIDGFSPKGSYAYFYSLDQLIVKNRNKRRLDQLVKIFDSYYPNSISVSKSLESYLNANKASVSRDQILKRNFMRADETLKENEGLKKIQLNRFFQTFKAQKSFKLATNLFEYKKTPKLKAYCNYNFKIYEKNEFLISQNPYLANNFGIKINNNSYLFSSTQTYKETKNLRSSPFIKGSSRTRSATFCNITEANKNLWMLSHNSRDPGQHLFHLLEYGISPVMKLSKIDELNRFSRHIFLTNPLRLIFESDRGNQGQLEELLKLKIPIYYASELATVTMYHSQSNQFLIDDRSTEVLSCFSD